MINQPNSPTAIIGAWKLASYTLKTPTGKTVDLWGKNTDGMIIYLDNGYMSVHVADQDRPKFEKDDFLSGTAEEIKSAFEGYTTYFGTYEYKPEEEIVLHHVMESVYPNWSGVTHKRFASLDHDTLLLKTPPIVINQEACTMELHWRRL